MVEAEGRNERTNSDGWHNTSAFSLLPILGMRHQRSPRSVELQAEGKLECLEWDVLERDWVWSQNSGSRVVHLSV